MGRRRRNGIRRGSAVGRAYTRWRSNECSFCLPPSQCRSFIDGLVEAQAGATDWRREAVGRWWKGEEW